MVFGLLSARGKIIVKQVCWALFKQMSMKFESKCNNSYTSKCVFENVACQICPYYLRLNVFSQVTVTH